MSVARHLTFEVNEASQVGQVRRAAAHMADEMGLDLVAAGRVALVATELGTNLVRHARRGRLLVAPVVGDNGLPMLEFLSLDQGPGIADLAACMADGYSTGGTPGTGLGAVRRLADEFDAFSTMPHGTVIMARVGVRPGLGASTVMPPAAKAQFVVGAVNLAFPGEIVSGDAWAFAADGQRAALLVADGLGHGPEAAEASHEAVRVFRVAPFDAPGKVIDQVHQALRTTRGAAVALANVDLIARKVLFCGVGNIAGRLISGVEDRSMASQHGTAGVQIRRVTDLAYDWPAHGLLIMHSDGLTARWDVKGASALLRQHPTVVAAWLMRDHCRGRDDATVVVVKWRGAS